MSSAEEICKNIDELINQKADRQEMFDIMEKAYENHKDDVEILWRFARAYYMISEIVPENERYDTMKKGEKHALVCIEKAPEHYAGYKWYGILLGSSVEYESIQTKIKNGFIIRDNLQKSVDLNSGDATSLFALGKMSYKVASLGKIQRAMATAIFGEVPFSTMDETIDRFLGVEEILKDPSKKQYKELIIRNKVWLGDSYYHKSDYENAKKWYNIALEHEATTDLDKEFHGKATKNLKSCSSSWW